MVPGRTALWAVAAARLPYVATVAVATAKQQNPEQQNYSRIVLYSHTMVGQEIGWLFASLSRQPTLPQQQQPAAAVLADGCEKSQGHSAGMLASRNS